MVAKGEQGGQNGDGNKRNKLPVIEEIGHRDE